MSSPRDRLLRPTWPAATPAPARPPLIGARVRRLALVAAVGFAAILLVTVALGLGSQRALSRLERQHYPSLELTRRLDDLLAAGQGALQDAVAVADRERLADADSARARAARALAAARQDGVLAPDDARALGEAFDAYFRTARATTTQLLAHDRGDAVGREIARMVRDYNALRERLAERRTRDARAVADAFATARRAQTAMWLGIALVTALALAGLAGLARRLVRDIVRPIEGAVQAAERLAEGDLTVSIPDAPADEVGQLLAALRRTVAYLHEMSDAADAIAAGDVSASPPVRSTRDRLGTAFAAMTRYLHATATAAERLAHGDLTLKIAPRSSRDVFGRSLGITIERLSSTIQELRASEARALTAEREARAGEARFRALVHESSDVIAVTDAAGRLTYLSTAAARVFGWVPEAHVGTPLLDLVHPDDVPAVRVVLAGSFAAPAASGRFHHRVRHGDGTWRHVESVGTNLLHDPSVRGFVFNARDVTERTELEAQLTHQAFHDPLTGLANRVLFRDRVEQALRREERAPEHAPAVLFLDLDNFKTVNDSLGHDAGDRLLRVIAARLLNATRGCDTVARLGGDEFAILVEHAHTADDAVAVAERVNAAMHQPVPLDGAELFVGGSIGIALAERGMTAEVLLRNADAAMYGAKSAGKGCHQLFEPSLLEAAMNRIEIEADLVRGIARGEFRLVYQPIVDLETGATVGAEALSRWHHPTRGLVSPARFVPLAEEAGHIVALGRWVLGEACREAAGWPGAEGRPAPYVTVNVSGRQLADPTLIDDVRAAIAASGLAAERLTLEFTESVIMQDTERTLAQLHALKALGVRLAIDDFGTGYSSLAYLQRFPVDVLKLDKSFVDGIERGGHDAALARTIVALGEMLSLRTVAEGIELEEQRRHLLGVGCGYGQGYLFARPLDPDALRARLAAAPVPAER